MLVRRLGNVLVAAAIAVLISSCSAQSGDPDTNPEPVNLGRGVNFGNMLEAPNEGDWGVRVREEYAQLVADAGFQTVRLPVKWSGHAGAAAPYIIDSTFLARVDEIVGWLLEQDLNVILDFHHYDELVENPSAHADRFIAIWRQLAQHYSSAPNGLLFELLNEPSGALDDDAWNALYPRALAAVRETNPYRKVVIGPTAWNGIGALPGLVWPDDKNVIVTVHYYDPFSFTHQGAEWANPRPPVGVEWTGVNITPRAAWTDFSWDTARTYTDKLTVEYLDGWAGFYVHTASPVQGYTQVALRTSRAMSLIITCGADGTGTGVSTVANELLLVNTTDCGGSGGFNRLMVQNGTGSAQAPYDLLTLELRGPGGPMPLLVTEADAIGAAFDLVVDWASANGNPPVFLGEFGAYGTADMQSRARWTSAVRQAAEERGFGWAYWELAAGFGVYDPVAEAWRQPLLDALVAGD